MSADITQAARCDSPDDSMHRCSIRADCRSLSLPLFGRQTWCHCIGGWQGAWPGMAKAVAFMHNLHKELACICFADISRSKILDVHVSMRCGHALCILCHAYAACSAGALSAGTKASDEMLQPAICNRCPDATCTQVSLMLCKYVSHKTLDIQLHSP